MRIALGIEYNGYEYVGWQTQDGLLTIQECLEKALTAIASEPIKVVCAGRTDAGVHAVGQVIHFDTQAQRPLRAWTVGTNTHLPATIAVRWAQLVNDSFHARFSAIARAYRYVIYNHSLRPAILSHGVTWYYRALDIALMQTAGQYLIGEHDFNSFRSAACEAKTSFRCIQSLTITRQHNFVYIDIQANAFLQHMVRNIAGVLMKIGAGLKAPEWALEVLQAQDRRAAADTASPAGLYLAKVHYPAPYNFPEPMVVIRG